MKQELQDKLIKKYPEIFKEIDSDPRYSCMAWGIECGDGWFAVIDTLCGFIDNTASNVNRRWRHANSDRRLEVRAAQVKQKYGSLRFYLDIGWSGGDLNEAERREVDKAADHIYGAVGMAERMTHSICESCGRPGSINPGFVWLRCECDLCKGTEL
jgi:hypothetical protein